MNIFIKQNTRTKQILALIVLAYFFLMLGNGVLSLTNPDEVFYAQTAKEMMQKNSWMTPYLFGEPQFEKPIFTYWLLRLGFELFGVSSFSARFFPALWGILGILAVYGLGLVAFKDDRKAFLSAAVMMSSSLYLGLARTVFTDLFFSVFILFSLSAFYWSYVNRERKAVGLLLAFLSSGLAVLTKGPLGLLIPGAVIFCFLVIKRDLKFLFCRETIWGFLLWGIVAVPWYAFMIKKYGSVFTREFFYNDHIRRLLEAEHKGNDTWYFYAASVIGCMVPWSFYTLPAFGRLFSFLKRDASGLHLFLGCWIALVLLIFEPAHSKLVSYIFPLFPAVALLVGDYLCSVLAQKPGRSFFFASWATTLFLSCIPVGLIVATKLFSGYIVSKTPIYILCGFFLAYLLLLVFSLVRRRYFLHVALTALVLPILLYFAFFVHHDFEAYASSQKACALFDDSVRPQGRLLVSKFFARGVRYFTDQDVAVIDINGKGYFSPHPVPYLNTDEGVRVFLRSQPVTYAVLRKGAFKDLSGRIIGNEFSAEILNVCGDEYVVKISRR